MRGKGGAGEWPVRWEVWKVGSCKCGVKFWGPDPEAWGEAAGELTSWAHILAGKNHQYGPRVR